MNRNRLYFCLAVLLGIALIAIPTIAEKGGGENRLYKPGFDDWGYNYTAHIFNGLYENYSRPAPPVTESDTWLEMKWSDEWLSDKDRDGDGKLDRGGEESGWDGISRGWLTNHQRGTYTDAEGEEQSWNYFVKIVYVGPPPEEGEDPYAETRIWGQYAIIQEVYNDTGTGEHGLLYKDPAGPGLGKVWTP